MKIKARNTVTVGVPHADGHAAAQKLLSQQKPPTAIYTMTDLLAFGILDGARALGVKVPDDVWVIGYDNTDLAAWESFDLTSVAQPIHAIVEIRRRPAASPHHRTGPPHRDRHPALPAGGEGLDSEHACLVLQER